MKIQFLVLTIVSSSALAVDPSNQQRKPSPTPAKTVNQTNKPVIESAKSTTRQNPNAFNTPELRHTMHHKKSMEIYNEANKAMAALAKSKGRKLTAAEKLPFIKALYEKERDNHLQYSINEANLYDNPVGASHEMVQVEGYRAYLSGDKKKIQQYKKEHPEYTYIVEPQL